MKLDWKLDLIVIAAVFAVFLLVTWMRASGYEAGYRQACIDCYKGQMSYILVDNDDCTRTWKKMDNADHRKQRGRTAPNLTKEKK